MVFSKILGATHKVPKTIVTNDDLAQIMETSDDWIQSHIGIKERRMSLEGENTSQLATDVALELVEQTNTKPEEIDLIIVATFTPDSLAPATAAIIQKELKAKNAWAFDLNTACSGFMSALSTADKFIQSGQYKKVLVIASDVNSKMLDFKDRTSSVFFGDGAGGVLLGTGNQPQFINENLYTVDDQDLIYSGRVNTIDDLSVDNYPSIGAFHQHGRGVYQQVVSTIPSYIESFLAKNELTVDDIDYYVTHQANLRLIEKLAELIHQPIDKFSRNVEYYGNTSAAGMAIGLAQLMNSEVDLTGKKVLLVGFGAGFTYGCVLLQF
ncbi:beta-ketoacyl-ACP synthase III [Holzapfeliella sp. He02]|uniref:Beta-ketoacyl-ACP synthase III n=1 Tax=Holzapfeliella saturejae TaxID=3082953 RepID=A0ABU8SE84_9LACO